MAAVGETRSRRERRVREVHDRIVAAAMDLFGTRGVESTKIDEICEAADIAQKTFFNHFPTKQHLVLNLEIREVIRRANATMFGLGSGVWTRDVSKAHRLAKAIRAGSVWVNCYQAMDPAVPFGGYKMSGYGRESGLQHVEEYLNVKAVWIKTD